MRILHLLPLLLLLPACTARPLIGGNQQEEERSGGEICQVQPEPVNSTKPPSIRSSAILRPRLPARLCSARGVRSNLRTSLSHCRKSLSPQRLRKPTAEDISVRMAVYKLVLIRHGESCWNQENRFCGWFDADLSETGEHEAKRGGQALKGRAETEHTSRGLTRLSLGVWV